MYEHFRNDFQCAAADHGVPQETIVDMLGLLDNLASRYEIHRKETSLALFHEELPEIVKIYIVSKKIEGLSQATLDTYLRMLTPRELYNAMGFPVDYIIERDYQGNVYGKTKQVARCGNAVCPPLTEAMVRANLPEWCGQKITTMRQLDNAVAV